MRGEMVRSCKVAQVSYMYCDPEHNSLAATYLSDCIYEDSCEQDELDKTNCKAPPHEHCSEVSTMEAFFWVNALINFFTYAEPAWFALLLLLRMEKDLDRINNSDIDDEEESPNPGFPLIFKCQEGDEDAVDKSDPDDPRGPLLGDGGKAA
eukprot:TRINITY_DN16129_c0_g1_i3.p1 TRINITY_DN16129_c0_g1~~TRINITY_DN16129_c0_g1_i3.p1  ORF type:complete len:151 (+),score=40.32 TRINITY_DN16129_c0_g1_i3:307-759(+)